MSRDLLERANLKPKERELLEFLGECDRSSARDRLVGCRKLSDYIRQGPDYSTTDVQTAFDKAFVNDGMCSPAKITESYYAMVKPREAAIREAGLDACSVLEITKATSDLGDICQSEKKK
jgi:hypothetical protein